MATEGMAQPTPGRNRGNNVRHHRRRFVTVTTALAIGLLAAACSNNNSSGTGTTGPTTGGSGTHVIPSTAPGVTNSSITVGSLTTASGALAAQFAQLTDGVQAYFDAVNAAGGVDGR
ncbi:MAG TPA: hypothetical protein VID75_07880, partial [Acidimicrobiales bacterium]